MKNYKIQQNLTVSTSWLIISLAVK